MCYYEQQLVYCLCTKGNNCSQRLFGATWIAGKCYHKTTVKNFKGLGYSMPRVLELTCATREAEGGNPTRVCIYSPPVGEYNKVTNWFDDEVCDLCRMLCSEQEYSPERTA